MASLKETFTASGKDKAEFIQLCKDIDRDTDYIKIKGPALKSFKQSEADEAVYGEGFVLKKSTLDAFGAGDVYNEFVASRAPVISVAGETLLSNNRAIAEMANQNGLTGNALVRPSAKRDAFVEELAENTKMTAVVRRSGQGVGKVMSIRSAKYHPIPLSTIEDVFWGFLDNEVVGKYKVEGWSMTQDTACLQIELPDIGDDIVNKYPSIAKNGDKWYPGAYFKNGTTGYTPMSVEMYYRKVDSKGNLGEPIYCGRAYAKHFAAFDKASFIKKVQNDIWGKYLQMPERLAAMANDIVSAADYETVLNKIFKFIKINKVFQKKDTETCRYLDKIWDNTLNTIKAKGQHACTMYEIVDIVMEIPTRVTVPAAYEELLKETCGRAWQYET